MQFDLEQLKASNLRTRDIAAYQRVHVWIARQRGKASMCSIDPKHKTTRYHWANISGEYKYEVSDWRQLCPSCHGKSDYTDNHRRLMSIRSRGNTSHNTPVVGIDEGGAAYYYDSITEASTSLGIIITAISNCLRGRTKTAGRLKWVYQEVYLGL